MRAATQEVLIMWKEIVALVVPLLVKVILQIIEFFMKRGWKNGNENRDG